MSLQDRTLDSMFPIANPAQISGVDDSNTGADPPPNASKSKDIQESECYLTSVNGLRDSVTKNKHNRRSPNLWSIELLVARLRFIYLCLTDLTEILEKHIFVGIVDLDRCLSLLQHSTKLYLVNHGALAYVLSYVDDNLN